MKALYRQPWSFNKALLVFKEFEDRCVLLEIQIDSCPFWVHIYGVPMTMRSEKVGIVLGEKIEVVEEVSTNQNKVALGKYMRVRVVLNVFKPLKKGCRLNMSGEHHVEKAWLKEIELRMENKVVRRYFGPELTAESPKNLVFSSCHEGTMVSESRSSSVGLEQYREEISSQRKGKAALECYGDSLNCRNHMKIQVPPAREAMVELRRTMVAAKNSRKDSKSSQ
ncbi:hypothetical protein PTKIN_Ptkin03bG0127600 [Pterospermum kingtungense]